VYRWVEHTAELELAVSAASEPEALADAVRALRELIDPDGTAAPVTERRVAAAGRDRPAAFAGWLEELVYLAESEGFVAIDVLASRWDGDTLETTVAGGPGEPRPVVKAVTLHGLRFETDGRRHLARVVLDV
jgi:SHS2 domain-containing protein